MELLILWLIQVGTYTQFRSIPDTLIIKLGFGMQNFGQVDLTFEVMVLKVMAKIISGINVSKYFSEWTDSFSLEKIIPKKNTQPLNSLHSYTECFLKKSILNHHSFPIFPPTGGLVFSDNLFCCHTSQVCHTLVILATSYEGSMPKGR